MTAEAEARYDTFHLSPDQTVTAPDRRMEPATQSQTSRSGAAEMDVNNPSDMDHILERVMTRLDENDRRYGAALDGFQSRLSQVSSRAGEARTAGDPAAKAALERVKTNAAALSREVEQAASPHHTTHDNDAFRAIEEKISDFALRVNDRESHRPSAPSGGSRPAAPPKVRPATPNERHAGDQTSHARVSLDMPPMDMPPMDRPANTKTAGGPARDMFSETASRFEQTLRSSPPSAGLEAINQRMDELAQRLDDTLTRRPDAASIERIEAQLSEIVPHFSTLQDQHRRLEAVEHHLHGLIDWLRTSGSQIETVARQAAEEAVRQMPSTSGNGTGNDQQLESIQYELRTLNERAERLDERTVRALEAMTQSMHLLAQRLDEPAQAGRTHRDAGSGWRDAARVEPGRDQGEETAEVHISRGGSGELPEARHEEPEDLDALGASIPDFQSSEGPRTPPAASDKMHARPAPDSRDPRREPAFDDEDDFIAAARRAAQSAAARTAPEPRRSLFRRQTHATSHAPEFASAGHERLQRVRPFFVGAAVLLLCVSAILFYERLKSKPDTPPAITPLQSVPAPAPGPLPGLPQKSSESLAPQKAPLGASGEPGRLARAFDGPVTLERPQAPAPAPAPEPSSIPSSLEKSGLAGSVIDRKAFQTPDNSRLAAEMFGAPITGHETPAKQKAPAVDTSRLQGAVVSIVEPERVPAQKATAPVTARQISATAAPEQTKTVRGVAAGSLPPATIGPESLRLAAARGNPAAQYEIGARYAKGSGVPVDMERAAQWFARSAAQGLAPSQFRLASLHERGQGVEADLGKAMAWYERAAQQGHIKAMHNLGVMLSDDKPTAADYTSAAAWFQRAAQHGLTDSQFNLGILYESGLGVQKNAAEAYRWFSTAAARGDREAGKRREQARTQLSAKMLQQLDQFLTQWRPDQPDTAANDVRAPEGGWTAAAAGQNAADAGDELVAVAQKLLNALGYDAGVPDGVLGPQTISAIQRFETRSGLKGSGSVTPDLVAKLKSLAS